MPDDIISRQIPELPASTGVLPSDLFIARQGNEDKSVTGSLIQEFAEGLIPYSPFIDYSPNEYRKGSNGFIYQCLAVNGPSTTVRNPVGDTTNTWRQVLPALPQNIPYGNSNIKAILDGLGTAATRDVGTAINNLMAVGAFGLGNSTQPNTITTTAQLDRLGTTGVYGTTGDIIGLSPTGDAGVLVLAGAHDWVQIGWQGNQGLRYRSNDLNSTVTPHTPDPTGWSEWKSFATTNDINLSNYVPTSRAINTNNGLTGGGSLTANRTIGLAATHIPIGVGQTWQQWAWSSGSRNINTNYTNTTGRPIVVAITGASNIRSMTLTVNGVMVANDSVGDYNSAAGGLGHSWVMGIVPHGGTYRVAMIGTSSPRYNWAELR